MEFLAHIYIIRKMGHVTIYIILTLLLIKALYFSGIKKNKLLSFISFSLSFLYTITDEYHQSLTGYRDGRWEDVAIDSIGIIFAILIVNIYFKRKRKRNKDRQVDK